MDDVIHAALLRWGNFYLITGLQFVVQTLMASGAVRIAGGDDPAAGIEAFGTPTVVHFTSALVISALLSVPWPGYVSLAATLGVVGAAALLYSGLVLRRARRQRSYVPVAEDWLFHVVLPAAAYAAILLAAFLLGREALAAEFLFAGATLVLLCVGIHNAWDTVAYLIVTSVRHAAKQEGRTPPVAAPLPERRGDRKRRRRGR
jgi:hypothetical protein